MIVHVVPKLLLVIAGHPASIAVAKAYSELSEEKYGKLMKVLTSTSLQLNNALQYDLRTTHCVLLFDRIGVRSIRFRTKESPENITEQPRFVAVNPELTHEKHARLRVHSAELIAAMFSEARIAHGKMQNVQSWCARHTRPGKKKSILTEDQNASLQTAAD